MRIIKTSYQAKAEQEQWEKAQQQAMNCPECGKETSVWERCPIAKGAKCFYICECKYCGCEWETDSW